jgi:hypothetical protein
VKDFSEVRPGDLLTVATIGGPKPAHYVRPLRGSRNQLVGWHQVTLIYPSGAEGKPRRFHEDDIEWSQRCRVCGCSDFFACKGGCSWVEEDLCSRCLEQMEAAG